MEKIKITVGSFKPLGAELHPTCSIVSNEGGQFKQTRCGVLIQVVFSIL
nr:hypothetical protein [Paenibacillus xylanexedens]